MSSPSSPLSLLQDSLPPIHPIVAALHSSLLRRDRHCCLDTSSAKADTHKQTNTPPNSLVCAGPERSCHRPGTVPNRTTQHQYPPAFGVPLAARHFLFSKAVELLPACARPPVSVASSAVATHQDIRLARGRSLALCRLFQGNTQYTTIGTAAPPPDCSSILRPGPSRYPTSLTLGLALGD